MNFGSGAWLDGGVSSLRTDTPRKVAASGVWSAEDTFSLTLCQYETPFTITLDFRFEGGQVRLSSRANQYFGPAQDIQLVGKAKGLSA